MYLQPCVGLLPLMRTKEWERGTGHTAEFNLTDQEEETEAQRGKVTVTCTSVLLLKYPKQQLRLGTHFTGTQGVFSKSNKSSLPQQSQ